MIVVKNRTEFSGNLRVVTDLLWNENNHMIYVYKDGLMISENKMILEAKGIKVLEGWSIVSIYHLLTAGIFIFSHAPRDGHITKRCKNRKIINLWHGVAFKCIENLMPRLPSAKQKQIETNAGLYDVLIASSETDKRTNMAAFMLEEEKVKITGLPRYDLLKEEYPLDSFLSMQKNKILAFKKDKTFILYAPTFRENGLSPLEQLSNKDWDMISYILEKNNAIMAIRPHAYDVSIPSYIQINSNFCWLPHASFTETNLILRYADILLVDFSSIWIDFLLLEKTIIGFAKDFESYTGYERGFAYDFKTTFPDTFFYTTQTLCDHLDLILKNKMFSKQYLKALKQFHKYKLKENFSEHFKLILKDLY